MAHLNFIPRLCNSILKRYFNCNVIPSSLFSNINNSYTLQNWANELFVAPSPHFIKQVCVVRNGIENSTWIETGTYKGDTTLVLSKIASTVYSLEPEITLFKNAIERFKDIGNVNIINGTSEDVLPKLLPKLSGDVSFWLDGHYSGESTFEGTQETPIFDELNTIKYNMDKFEKISIMVDDIRCFVPGETYFETYPLLDELIDWIRDNNLNWHIEHDILVVRNY